jgi:hypothetical protein
MEVSGQLHASAVLPSGKEPVVPIGWENCTVDFALSSCCISVNYRYIRKIFKIKIIGLRRHVLYVT